MSKTFILETKSLFKRFGDNIANDNINLKVKKGEIHAIVGENGAGKSTLMKCIYGIYKPDKGKILLNGKEVDIKSPKDAMKLGIGMVHQHFMLIPSLPVYINVVLGKEPKAGINFDKSRALNTVKSLIKRYNLDVDPTMPVHKLSVGLKQKVEILKLLYKEADILIFDEPTTVLSPQEIDSLFNTLRLFKERGKTIIFIAHKLKEVIEIADRISVMRKGRLVATLDKKEATPEILAELMIGESKITTVKTKEGTKIQTQKPVLELKNVTIKGEKGEVAVSDLSLTVYSGEILGIAGVMGNGQSELEEAIIGIRKVVSGTIKLNNIDITHKPPSERRKLGFACVPEDRIATALVPLATVKENLILGHHRKKRFTKAGLKLSYKITKFAKDLIKKYDIHTKSENIQVGILSGGNMQRVVIARELEHKSSFMLISQPTRGIDIKGIKFIHSYMMEIKEKGVAILLISADLDEIIELSDRVAIMYKGKIIKIVKTENTNKGEIGRLMLGKGI